MLDATGKAYVANNDAGTITEYAPGANGNIKAETTITGISSPRALALNSSGDLFVSTIDGPIHEYAPGASGAATPIATISGQHNAEGLVFDSAGNLWVEYASGASSPTDTISGSSTGLDNPGSVAATPPLSIVTTTLPRARRGRKYLVNLRATEGTTPYRWARTRGHLPRGLKLEPSGAIEGTPRGRLRTYSFTVKVRDSSRPQQVVTQHLKLRLRR